MRPAFAALKTVLPALLFVSTFVPPPTRAAEDWKQAVWNGEPAWVSTNAGVRAVVTAARARLIYFGAADGSRNLLSAPAPVTAPGARNRWPNWGGHRFWLGPQSRWVWPPPAEWEYSAATRVEARGGVLEVAHPRNDPAYPALTREYAWEGGRLRCTVRWPDEGRPFFGLHVVAIDVPAVVAVVLRPTERVPDGVVFPRFVDPPPSRVLPYPALEVSGGRGTMRSGVKSGKLGFTPQSLEVARPGGWTLVLHPGPGEGRAVEEPDQGFLSQVWVGAAEHDFAEIEQLTPFLAGDASGRCASTVYLEARAPAR